MKTKITILSILVALLAALLPWHGAITVFLPEPFRYWKEFLLVSLFLVALIQEILQLKKKKVPEITTSEFWAMGFLGVIVFLLFWSDDLSTSLLAARYLGLGFLVYLIFSSLIKHTEKSEKVLHNFSKVFVISCVLSVLFGIWIKFLGGAGVVQEFYSQTISSWVPGQTIPLWHETGEFIRLQGASSGPIEFSHLLLVAVFLQVYKFTSLQDHKFKRILSLLFLVVLIFGIVQSFSRAALLGLVVVVLFWGAQRLGFSLPKVVRKKYFKGVLLGGVLFLVSSVAYVALTSDLAQNFWNRAGTSDHFTRPIEAMEVGIKKPILGHLGEWGPAARTRNLITNNDDNAPIAENVFADWFVQLGILGLVAGIGFFISLVRRIQPEFWGIFVAMILMMNFATVLDMTPISIVFFLVLAFSQKEVKKRTGLKFLK